MSIVHIKKKYYRLNLIYMISLHSLSHYHNIILRYLCNITYYVIKNKIILTNNIKLLNKFILY